MKAHALSPAEIKAFPHKNVILRALGMKPVVDVDVDRVPLEVSDVLLLCSDGLSSMVPDARIAEILRAVHGDLRLGVNELVEAANAAGGLDNVTVVLVQAVR
jgi:protein phosphatase